MTLFCTNYTKKSNKTQTEVINITENVIGGHSTSGITGGAVMAMNSMIKVSDECPADLRLRKGIFILYAMQHFESTMRNGKLYGPGLFYKQVEPVLKGLKNLGSRRTTLNHLNDPRCVVCGDAVSTLQGRKFDHIIPTSAGGPDDMANMMVLCKTHNSSKGKKDLLDWWMSKGWRAADLQRSILCLYARLMWAYHGRILPGVDIAPDYMRAFIEERSKALFPKEHIVAMYGSASSAMIYLALEDGNGTTSVL